MESLIQDIRYGARTLLQKPAFTAAAVIALALGIGANTAIFSVVDKVLLDPLPYNEPDRLMMVWESNIPRNLDRNVISPMNFLRWREQNRSFEQMAAFITFSARLTNVEEPEVVPTQFVTTNFFDVLETPPLLGQTFGPEHDTEDTSDVAVISYGFWQRRFGGDPGVVGSTITLNDTPTTIVGVMPADFNFFVQEFAFVKQQPEIWSPFVFTPQHREPGGRFLSAIGRLKPGVTHESAQAEMETVMASLVSEYEQFNTGWSVALVPLREQLVGSLRPALMILFGAVGLVLLIACANVANLLLTRATTRRREMAVRSALGAGRWRIVRQLLTESMLLSLLGGAVGVAIAFWGVDLLRSMGDRELIDLGGVGIDFGVLGFTVAICAVSGVIFGLAPAVQVSRVDLVTALKEGGKGTTTSGSATRTLDSFVVVQVALALVLLIGSSLLMVSFIRLQSVDPGFASERLLTFNVSVSSTRYPEDAQVTAFFRQLRERVAALPGVRSASYVSFLPFAGPGSATSYIVDGKPEPPAGQRPVADVRIADATYFETMDIPLLEGRNFTESEMAEAAHVVIINEAMAQAEWPGESAIGKTVRIRMMDPVIPSTVIGVVGDIRIKGLDVPPRAMTYWPHPELAQSGMGFVVRSEMDPTALVPAIRDVVRGMDPNLPIANVRTMDELLADSVARSRFAMLLLGLFAGVALLLSAVGIYGVMSYSVVQRTHEIGVRMALGARAGDVLKMVVRRGMVLAAIGIAIGLVGAFGLTRVMESLLYEVSTTDPIVFAAVPVLLAGVAFLATYIPARRATRVDPMQVLRYE